MTIARKPLRFTGASGALLQGAIACAFLIALAAGAPSKADAQAGGLGGSFGDEIDLEARTLKLDTKDNEFVGLEAHGEVVMISQSYTLLCDHLTYDADKGKMFANAEPGKRVRVKSEVERTDVECGRLVYHLDSGKYELFENVRGKKGDLNLSGQTITLGGREGQGRMINNSGAAAARSQAVAGTPGETDKTLETMRTMQQTLGLSEHEAYNIISGAREPATMTFNTRSGAEEGGSEAKPAPGGRLTPDNLDAIPDRSGSRPLEVAR